MKIQGSMYTYNYSDIHNLHEGLDSCRTTTRTELAHVDQANEENTT